MINVIIFSIGVNHTRVGVSFCWKLSS